jgi:hypothetical protein
VHDRHDVIGPGLSCAASVVCQITVYRTIRNYESDSPAARAPSAGIGFAQCDRSVGGRLRLLR